MLSGCWLIQKGQVGWFFFGGVEEGEGRSKIGVVKRGGWWAGG